jgi:hypothetical protein
MQSWDCAKILAVQDMMIKARTLHHLEEADGKTGFITHTERLSRDDYG